MTAGTRRGLLLGGAGALAAPAVLRARRRPALAHGHLLAAQPAGARA